MSDGAAALLLATSERAAELGLRPLARIHTAVVAASDPRIMLTAPIPATEKALKKAALDLADIHAFEVNEAFAAFRSRGWRKSPWAWSTSTLSVAPLRSDIHWVHPERD